MHAYINIITIVIITALRRSLFKSVVESIFEQLSSRYHVNGIYWAINGSTWNLLCLHIRWRNIIFIFIKLTLTAAWVRAGGPRWGGRKRQRADEFQKVNIESFINSAQKMIKYICNLNVELKLVSHREGNEREWCVSKMKMWFKINVCIQ